MWKFFRPYRTLLSRITWEAPPDPARGPRPHARSGWSSPDIRCLSPPNFSHPPSKNLHLIADWSIKKILASDWLKMMSCVFSAYLF